MLAPELARVALDAVRANKLRSILTMLGIVIGVAAVIAMVALGNGAQQAVRDRISRLGTTLLQINPTRVVQAGVATSTIRRLVPADADAISARAPDVAAVDPEQNGNMQVVWKRSNTNVQVTGAPETFLEVRGFAIARGRMFTSAEDQERQRVAVLGAHVLPLLDVLDADAILGETVRIQGEAFTVIGVLAEKGQTSAFGDPDEVILVPFNTGRFRLFGNDRLNSIQVLAASETAIPDAMGEIETAMRRAHHLRVNDPDDFQIRDQADFLTTLGETTATFGALLAGIAAVSLVVGGIGIMNIMLVSVTERTREIGIRKALGATRINILFQFLTEAVVLCTAGGAVGVAVGLATADELHRAMGWNTAVTTSSVVLALAVAAATGLVFGVWPARRAAGLDPIEALRYE